jgi:hypothetical protein
MIVCGEVSAGKADNLKIFRKDSQIKVGEDKN